MVEDLGFGRLLLHGTRCQNLLIKRMLLRIDVPWPAVQLNLWAIQVSDEADPGDRKHSEVSNQVKKIRERISKSRDDVIKVQTQLKRLAAAGSFPWSFPCDDWPKEQPLPSFAAQPRSCPGSKTTCDSPPLPPPLLSINEALLLLSLRQDRETQVGELAKFAKDSFTDKKPYSSHRGVLDHPFQHLRVAVEAYGPYSCETLARFLASYDRVRKLRYQDVTDARYQHCTEGKDLASEECRQEAALNEVLHAGEVTDRMLRALMDAFAADMEELFFQPLLEGIREEEGREHAETALVGHNRIVVTSGLEADLLPEISLNVETTPPILLTKDLLAALSSGNKTEQGPIAKLISQLPQEQAALLAAALAAGPEPRYVKVAPGITIGAIPTVLPDQGAARLVIDAKFGVTVDEFDPKARKDPWIPPPPAGVLSHEVKTDVMVDAFDLFDISSFSIDVRQPQRARLVPVLGRLPIIGPAFQWPLPDQTVRHESIILVNTVILPRATMLTERY